MWHFMFKLHFTLRVKCKHNTQCCQATCLITLANDPHWKFHRLTKYPPTHRQTYQFLHESSKLTFFSYYFEVACFDTYFIFFVYQNVHYITMTINGRASKEEETLSSHHQFPYYNQQRN